MGDGELEITESMIIEQVDRSTAALKQIQGLAVGAALDDFGTVRRFMWRRCR
jgi:predicted signal transduction protein with EAL and GGDEF domain